MPSLEKRICVTAPCVSEADSVKVTVVLFVAGALPLMTTEPVGARLSTVTEIAVVVAVFPDVSRARACSVCVPLDAVVVFQEMLYGEVVSSVPISVLPSSRNCTPATATLSDAVAERRHRAEEDRIGGGTGPGSPSARSCRRLLRL